MHALLHAALKGLSIQPTTCTPVPALNDGAASAAGRITRPRHPSPARRCGPLLAALALTAVAPPSALGQTQACSFSNPDNDECSNLDPATCAALGGLPMGPGTVCGWSTEPGDLDGDGDMTALDVYPFALALLDPAEYGSEYPGGNMYMADFNHDGVLDGQDVGLFVAALFAPPRPCREGRRYALAYLYGSATGISAIIETCDTTLCGEPNSTDTAGSLAFVDISQVSFSGTPPVLHRDLVGQTGYIRVRSLPDTPPGRNVQVYRYAEMKAGPGPANYVFHPGPAAEPGPHHYDCHLVGQPFGVWQFDYDDDFNWFPVQRQGWVNQTANRYAYEAEIWNVADQMVGTPASHCLFFECQVGLSWGAFQYANITNADLRPAQSNSWGVERLDATAIGIWDKNP